MLWSFDYNTRVIFHVCDVNIIYTVLYICQVQKSDNIFCNSNTDKPMYSLAYLEDQRNLKIYNKNNNNKK